MSIKNKGGHYLRTVATHGRKSGHWLTQYAVISFIAQKSYQNHQLIMLKTVGSKIVTVALIGAASYFWGGIYG